MRQSTNQAIRPVVMAQRNLLAWSKFQTSMCSKMNQCIGTKSVLTPQIRSNVSMRRSNFRSMQNFKRIVSFPCSILRKQYDISQINARYRQSTIICSQVRTRKFTVRSQNFIVFVGTQGLFHPTFVSIFRNDCRLSMLHKFGHSSFGIRTEHSPLTLNHHSQFLG